jgi:aspartate aminotransferase
MADKVAQRINKFEESSTLKMAQLTRELNAKGKHIINLSLGEPDFDTPEHIREAAKKAIDDGYTHYPPVAGYMDLRQAVAEKFKRENGLDYSATQVVVSTGAKQSIMNVMMSLLEEGDEAIIPAPYWVSYPQMVKLTDAKTVFIETNVHQEYKITPEQLEKAITPRTKAFVYSSPSNPTGSVYTHEELKALAEVFARHPNVYIISDEIYEHINYTGHHASLAQFPEIFDRVIVINGVSKAFAMTGWRIGYMAGPQWITKACEKLQGQFTSAASSISQRATLAALTSDMQPTIDMKNAFQRRRDLLIEEIRAIPDVKFNVPQGAFYLLPDVSHYFGKQFEGKIIENADDFSMFLLEHANISMVSGTGFGAPDCIRISYAASEEMIHTAIGCLKEAVKKLTD